MNYAHIPKSEVVVPGQHVEVLCGIEVAPESGTTSKNTRDSDTCLDCDNRRIKPKHGTRHMYFIGYYAAN